MEGEVSASGRTPRHRSVADQLRSWTDAQISDLLTRRPDLATPAPHDFSQLASRVAVRSSITRALDSLTRGELCVLDALVSGGQTTDAEVIAAVPAAAGYVAAVLGRLRGLALVWDAPEGLRALSGVADCLAAGPSVSATLDRVDTEPALATTTRPAATSENAAAGAAGDLVRHVELLLERWGASPASALRSGGLGVRELRATAELLELPEPTAALVVETAAAAGLLASRADADGDQVWVPTDAFDRWLTRSVAARWVPLARAWLTSPRMPGLVGRRGADGKPWNALTPELASVLMPEARRMALEELLAVPDGEALASGTGLPSVVARVAWRRPRRPSTRADQVAWAISEAAVVGVTGRDALSPFGRALVAGDDPEPLLAALLPEPVDHVLIQADLTAVAPGPLDPDTARALQQVADVESRGAATVYRFTPTSVRRALDAGRTAAEVHAFLASVSRTPVPQPLTYLVDDAVRSFGRIRVGVAESFVRSDDETALTALEHDPKAAALGLRRIAPTVLISTTPVDLLLPRLRELGAAPVVEGPDGTVRVGAPEHLRARTPKPPRGAPAAARRAAQVATAVRALRSGDAAARTRPAAAVSPAGALSALRDAIERRAAVVIGFTDNQGVVGERVVEPIAVEGGRLTARDRVADDVRTFAVHRISRVTPVA